MQVLKMTDSTIDYQLLEYTKTITTMLFLRTTKKTKNERERERERAYGCKVAQLQWTPGGHGFNPYIPQWHLVRDMY